MKLNKKISSAAFKCRGLFWGIFAAGILIFPADFDIWRFVFGMIILILGQHLRF